MATYDDKTLECTPPSLGLREKEHVLVTQDECLNSTNEGQLQMWLQSKQPLKKKGKGWGIHICGWISKEIGHLRLSDEQLAAQATLPKAQCLPIT